jgi:hypothetical protein
MADEAAESVAQNEDGPDPEHAAYDQQRDADPARRLTVDGQDVQPIRQSRDERKEKSKHGKGNENPAIAAILTLARAQVSGREERYGEHDCDDDDERNKRRMRKESAKAAVGPYRQTELNGDKDNRETEELGAHVALIVVG